MPTAVNPAAIAALIERRNQTLNNYLNSPNADREILRDLGILNEAIAFSSPEFVGGSGGGSLPAGAATDANATAIGNTLLTQLQAIAGNTASDKFEYVLMADVIDENNSVTFYHRIDKTAGTVTSLSLALAPYTVVGTPRIVNALTTGKTAVSMTFEAKTNSAGNWSIDQPLRRVENWILGATSNTLVSSAWINDATGLALSVIPVIGTDVDEAADLTLDTLQGILTKLVDRTQRTQITDGAIDVAVKVSMPIATDPALIVAISPNSAPVDTELPVAAVLSDAIVNPTTPIIGAAAMGWTGAVWERLQSVAGSLKVALQSTTNNIGNVRVTDLVNFQPTMDAPGRRGYQQLTDGTNSPAIKGASTPAAATDPALVVAVSPNSGLATETTLTAVNNKLANGFQSASAALAVVSSRKDEFVGFTSAGFNNNLLDSSGAGLATDVRAYNSMQLTISLAASPLLTLSGGVNAAFTIGVTALDAELIAGTVSGFPIGTIATFSGLLLTTGIVKFNVDLSGVNYIRLSNNFISPGVGTTFYYTLSQSAIPKRVVLAPNSTLASAALSPLTQNIDVGSSAIGTTSTTSAVATALVSQQFELVVTTVGGTLPGLKIAVEESADGANWRTIYSFERVVAIGSYRSPLLPVSGRFVRYVQTVDGTTPAFTRSINRYSSNISITAPIGKSLGGFAGGATSIIDLPLHGRLRRLTANNRTAGLLFLQVHDKATALTAGNVPLNGQVYPLAAGSSLPFTVADFGEMGTWMGINPRIGISSTFNTYTAAVIAANQASLFVEVI